MVNDFCRLMRLRKQARERSKITGIPIHEQVDRIREQSVNRRELLKYGVTLGAALVASSLVPERLAAAMAPRIVIVGGGLAGITTAYRLWKSGYRSTVYEAHAGIGGRTSTIRNLPGGQWAERGGQSVSTDEKAIRQLVSELGLKLIDTYPVYPDGSTVYRFGNRNFSEDEIGRGLDDVYDAAEQIFDEVRYVARYNNKNTRTVYWDKWSVAEWLDEYCPGGLGSPLGQALKIVFESDYGVASKASALHLIYDYAAPGDGYDERYIISGGSDRVVTKMAQLLPSGTIRTGMPLTALHRNANGTVRSTFQSGFSLTDVTADLVVLALPFTVLRQVDFATMGFDPVMISAIRELHIGENSKVQLQFTSPVWEPRRNGESISNLITSLTWPSHAGQPGPQGLITCMNNDHATFVQHPVPHGPAPQAVVEKYLGALNQMLPGAGSVYGGVAYLDCWHNDPWVKGSYAYYATGQFTKFGGIEGKTQRNIFFAGEHTAAYESHGLMNGAIESGNRAANEILQRL